MARKSRQKNNFFCYFICIYAIFREKTNMCVAGVEFKKKFSINLEKMIYYN